MTGGCSKIVQDIPPYLIADGNPARVRGVNSVGLQRKGYPPEAIKALKECYRILYRKELNVGQAVEEIHATLPSGPEVEEFLKFVNASTRGIIK